MSPRSLRPRLNWSPSALVIRRPTCFDVCLSDNPELLAVRFAKEGIGVFDVRPGIIRSDMTAKVSKKYDRLIAEGLVPAGRWGEGDDVAGVVSALASGSFAFATGSVIDVGGGLAIERL